MAVSGGFCAVRNLLAAVAYSVVTLTAAPTPQDVRLALEPYFRDLKIAHVKAGTRLLTMLVDTGGGATAISPEIAAAAGCTPHGRDVGHRMTGEAVSFQRCESISLTAGRWSHDFSPIGVFDIGALLPKELPHLDGVLALDAFRGQVVTIDWNNNGITVVERGAERAAMAAHGLPSRLGTGETGRYLTAYVPVRGVRGLLWFLLDSGNLRGTLVAESVIKDGLLPLAADGLAVLTIGSRKPTQSPFSADTLVIDGVLGTDYLNRGPVTIDLRGHGLSPAWLPAPHAQDPRPLPARQ
jgi:hypothetical protein